MIPLLRLSAPVLLAGLFLSPITAQAEQDLETLARESLPQTLFSGAEVGSIDTVPQGSDALKVTYTNLFAQTGETADDGLKIKSISMRIQSLDENRVRITKLQLGAPMEIIENGAAAGTLAIEVRRFECDYLLAQESCQNISVELPSIVLDATAEGGLVTLNDLVISATTEVAADDSYETPVTISFSGLSFSEDGVEAFTMDRFGLDGHASGGSYSDYLAAAIEINDAAEDDDMSADDFDRLIESFLASFDQIDFTLICQGITLLTFGPPTDLGDLSFSLDMNQAEENLLNLGVGVNHMMPADRSMLAALADVPPEMLPDEAQILVDVARLPTEVGELVDNVEQQFGEKAPGGAQEAADPYLDAMIEAGTEIVVSGTRISGSDYLGTLTGGVVAGAEGFFGQIIGEIWGLDAMIAMVSGLPAEQQQQAMQVLGALTFMGRPEPDENGDNRLIYDIAFEKSGAILVNGEVIKPAGAQ